MDNNLLTPEKFKYIVSSTISECNRVLDIWSKNNQKISYNQQESLFKNYLSKFFRDKYNHLLYNKYIKRCDFSVIIKNDKIDKVSVGQFNSNNPYLQGIITELSNINSLSNTYIIEDVIAEPQIKSLIDYNRIINIKF